MKKLTSLSLAFSKRWLIRIVALFTVLSMTVITTTPTFASSIIVPSVIISSDPLSYALLSFQHLPTNYKINRINILFFQYPGHTTVEYANDCFLINGQWKTAGGIAPITVEANRTFGLEFPNGLVGHDAQVAVNFITPSGQSVLAKSVIFNSQTLKPVPLHEKLPPIVSVDFHINPRHDLTGISKITGRYLSKKNSANANSPILTMKAGTSIQFVGLGEPSNGIYGIYIGTESEYNTLIGSKSIGKLTPINTPAQMDYIDAYVTHPLSAGLYRVLIMNNHDLTYLQFSVRVQK